MMKFFPLLTALFLILNHACATGTVFQERLNYKIILPECASGVEKFAAAELKGFLAEIYDENLDRNNSRSKITFDVGNSSASNKAGFPNTSDLKTNFGIFRKGRSILLCGYDEENVEPKKTTKGYAGTLCAVYYFLNQHLGVSFLYPGDKGYLIAENEKIKFPDLSEIPVPSFQLRGVSMRTKAYTKDEMTLFFRSMLGNVPHVGHS